MSILADDSRLSDCISSVDSATAPSAISAHDFTAVCIDCSIYNASSLIARLVDDEVNVILMGLDADADAVCKWLEAGVAGYVCKDADVNELARTIDSAINKEVVCSREIAKSLHRRFRLANRKSVPMQSELLTSREGEIASLLRLGWSNKRIARQLRISISTTKNHVHNILAKLDVHSRGEAAAVLQRVSTRSNDLFVGR